MKAILINPKLQTIKEINYSGDYKDIYKLTECSTFTCVYPFHLNEDVIYLDDEGLLKESNYCFTFRCDNGHNPPLMGNALIVGTDEQGDSQDIESSIEMIKEKAEDLAFLVRVKQVNFTESCKEYKDDDIDGQKIRISVE